MEVEAEVAFDVSRSGGGSFTGSGVSQGFEMEGWLAKGWGWVVLSTML